MRRHRFSLYLLLSLLPCSALPLPAVAQEAFGSLSGVVTDDAGRPLDGIRVWVPALRLTARSNAAGVWRLPLVSPGTHVLRAADATGESRVHVTAGRTTVVDVRVSGGTARFQAHAEAPDGSLTLTGAALQTGSDDPRVRFTALPGVVLRDPALGIGGVDLEVRGGAAGGATATLEGAPLHSSFGGPLVTPPTAGVQSLTLDAGPGSPAIGTGSRGQLSYHALTAGAGTYAAASVATDQVSGRGLGAGYTRLLAAAAGSLRALPRLAWSAAVEAAGQEAAFAPVGAEALRFFNVSGIDTIVTWTSSAGPQTDTILAVTPVDARELPLSWRARRSLQGTLRYALGSASSLSLLVVSDLTQARGYPGNSILAPSLYRGTRAAGTLAVVTAGLSLGEAWGGAVALELQLAMGRADVESGGLTPASEADTREPALGFGFGRIAVIGRDDLGFPFGAAYERARRYNELGAVPFQGQNNLSPQSDHRGNPYGVHQSLFPFIGIGGRTTFAREDRRVARARVQWQRGPHRLSLGAEEDRTDLAWFDGQPILPVSLDAWVAAPSRRGVWLADEWRFRRARLELGVRYDRFDGGAQFPIIPGRIFTHPDWVFTNDDPTYAANLAQVFTPRRSQSVLAPLARLSMTVTEATSVRMAWRLIADPPPALARYAFLNTDLAFTGTATPFGRDVDIAAAWIADVGLTQRLSRALIADLSIAHTARPLYAPVFTTVFDPFRNEVASINMLTSLGRQGTTTLGAQLQWQLDSTLAAGLTGSVSRREGLGAPSVSTAALAATVAARLPLALDAVVTGRAVSGLRYGRQQNNGLGTIAPEAAPGDDTALPWQRWLDLHLSRRIGGRASLFVDVRNVLGTRNQHHAFAETGTTANPVHRNQVLGPQRVSLANEADTNRDATGTYQLANCAAWANVVNCLALRRVERRFGNGDQALTDAEYEAALNAYYDTQFGPPGFYAPGRTLRLGLRIE